MPLRIPPQIETGKEVKKGMYHPDIHPRKSIRLKRYDYSSSGAYFVTICTKNRECLFGEVVEGEMHLNEIGEMVLTVWEELPECYSGIGIGVFQIMPNHVHGIIILNHPIPPVGAGPRACPFLGQPRGVAPTMSLTDVVDRFKSLTTNRFRQIIKNYHCPLLTGQKLWQRNYYEHIIRNEKELNQIREYIHNNSLQWHLDRENPLRTGNEPLEEKIFGAK